MLLDLAGAAAGSRGRAEALSARLGGLPLALRLAGSYLAEVTHSPWPGSISTFESYQRALEEGDINRVFPEPSGPLGSEQARGLVGHTWELSLSLLDQRELPWCRTLLRLLSLWDDTPIPYTLLLDPPTLAASPLLPGLDEHTLWRSLRALANLGLIELVEPSRVEDGGVPVLGIHPLVRDTSRQQPDLTQRRGEYLTLAATLLHRAVNDSRGGEPENRQTWPVWQLLAAQSLHLKRVIIDSADVRVELIELVNPAAERAARYLQARGIFEAEAEYRQTQAAARAPAGLRRRSLADQMQARVLCPVCLRTINWRRAPLLEISANWEATPFRPRQRDEPVEAYRERQLAAVRACTASPDDPYPTHYLPSGYGEFGEPLVIAVIGNVAVGKTMLLAAMVDALRNTPLHPLGLTVRSLDPGLELRYLRDYVEPFLSHRRQLPLTHPEPATVTYAALIHSEYAGRNVPVAFFDVAGELYRSDTRSSYPSAYTAFLGAANAAIFVVDPEKALPTMLGRPGEPSRTDPTFAAAMDRMTEARANENSSRLPFPAAVVVTKSDLLQHGQSVVADWLTRRDDTQLSTIAEESASVYAFLARNGVEPGLTPVSRFSRATLHFVTSTGTSAADGGFPPDGFGPRRVLRPLLALFASAGVVDPERLNRSLASG
jgi:hypothetical protein